MQKENKRLNVYIGQITEDPQYQKSIKNRLVYTEIEGCLNGYEKDVTKQVHYYKMSPADQKDKTINNMATLLKNFKK